MSIYLYIFIVIVTKVIVLEMFVAINAYLKSHDKIFDAIEKIEKVKQKEPKKPTEWKPSEEQMRALSSVTKNLFPEMPERHRLESLYNDLKNL